MAVLVHVEHLLAAGVNISAEASNPWAILQSQVATMPISTIKPCRIEQTVPTDFRVAVYPDGVKRLQGAYHWQEGWNTQGYVWKDIPMVMVDDNGKEIL